jgi:hypothetical protein
MAKKCCETARLIEVEAFSAVRPTSDELAEFERLEAMAPLDEEGEPAWSFEGEPLTARERRWLELYRKLSGCAGAARTHMRRR